MKRFLTSTDHEGVFYHHHHHLSTANSVPTETASPHPILSFLIKGQLKKSVYIFRSCLCSKGRCQFILLNVGFFDLVGLTNLFPRTVKEFYSFVQNRNQAYAFRCSWVLGFLKSFFFLWIEVVAAPVTLWLDESEGHPLQECLFHLKMFVAVLHRMGAKET